MPGKITSERATKAKREGKRTTTPAGTARPSKARRAGVKVAKKSKPVRTTARRSTVATSTPKRGSGTSAPHASLTRQSRQTSHRKASTSRTAAARKGVSARATSGRSRSALRSSKGSGQRAR